MNRPPQKYIDIALQIENDARQTNDYDLYLECLNHKPMSSRVSNQELHDGCILSHHVYLVIKNNETIDND